MMKRASLQIVILAGLTLVLAACGATAAPEQPPADPPTPETESGETVEAEPEQPPEPVKESVPAEQPASAAACDGQPTAANAQGPFYSPGSPERASLIEEGMGGTPVIVTGGVFTADCQPVAAAIVDFWQTDDAGNYDNEGFRLRGHQFTAEDGTYELETILPGQYPGRTAHIHVKVFGPDGREWLTSQIYIPGLSEQAPDGIFDPALLARDLDPAPDGTRRLGFNFVVAQ